MDRFDLASRFTARARHAFARPVAPKSGIALPPTNLRMGGTVFKDDAAFLAGAAADTQKLVDTCGLGSESRLMDWGCGAGRLAIGIAERFGRIARYHGVDVQQSLIDWANANIGSRPGYEFTWVDVRNARYNPVGSASKEIPAMSGTYDIFHAFSVFTHLTAEDAAFYLVEVRRLLAHDGVAWITVFVEEGVDLQHENPKDYGRLPWKGPLHCVRFERGYFERLIELANLSVVDFQHGGEADGQSVYVVTRR